MRGSGDWLCVHVQVMRNNPVDTIPDGVGDVDNHVERSGAELVSGGGGEVLLRPGVVVVQEVENR